MAVAGTGLAAGSAATLQPEGVLAGGALVGDGLVATSVGSAITVSGATLTALSGSGKESATQLGAIALTRRIPKGLGRETASKAISESLNSVLPEFKSCR